MSVNVKRLVGVYSHSDQLVIYLDGTKVQIVALYIEAEIVGGNLGLSDKTTDFGYFTLDEIETLDIAFRHKDRIMETLADQKEAFIR